MSDIGPESTPRNPSMVHVPEVAEPQRITYKEFKEMDMSQVEPERL